MRNLSSSLPPSVSSLIVETSPPGGDAVDRGLQDFEVVDDDMAAMLREKTEWERLQIAFGPWRTARRLIRATTVAEHPDWTEAEVERHVAVRMSHGRI